ncbi:MAG: response regulator [Gammaproteobacteria bacterium]|jgi:two-component system cell cycle response regulator DivK
MSTILIVEDNLLNMKLARDILEAKGHAVLAAENGEDGVAAALEHLPDLILMDIQMPGIDGFEALARIRSDAAVGPIPVIAFTASVTASDRSRVTDAGFNAFISKPIDLKSFVATIDELLAGHTT